MKKNLFVLVVAQALAACSEASSKSDVPKPNATTNIQDDSFAKSAPPLQGQVRSERIRVFDGASRAVGCALRGDVFDVDVDATRALIKAPVATSSLSSADETDGISMTAVRFSLSGKAECSRPTGEVVYINSEEVTSIGQRLFTFRSHTRQTCLRRLMGPEPTALLDLRYIEVGSLPPQEPVEECGVSRSDDSGERRSLIRLQNSALEASLRKNPAVVWTDDHFLWISRSSLIP